MNPRRNPIVAIAPLGSSTILTSGSNHILNLLGDFDFPIILQIEVFCAVFRDRGDAGIDPHHISWATRLPIGPCHDLEDLFSVRQAYVAVEC